MAWVNRDSETNTWTERPPVRQQVFFNGEPVVYEDEYVYYSDGQEWQLRS